MPDRSKADFEVTPNGVARDTRGSGEFESSTQPKSDFDYSVTDHARKMRDLESRKAQTAINGVATTIAWLLLALNLISIVRLIIVASSLIYWRDAKFADATELGSVPYFFTTGGPLHKQQRRFLQRYQQRAAPSEQGRVLRRRQPRASHPSSGPASPRPAAL